MKRLSTRIKALSTLGATFCLLLVTPLGVTAAQASFSEVLAASNVDALAIWTEHGVRLSTDGGIRWKAVFKAPMVNKRRSQTRGVTIDSDGTVYVRHGQRGFTVIPHKGAAQERLAPFERMLNHPTKPGEAKRAIDVAHQVWDANGGTLAWLDASVGLLALTADRGKTWRYVDAPSRTTGNLRHDLSVLKDGSVNWFKSVEASCGGGTQDLFRLDKGAQEFRNILFDDDPFAALGHDGNLYYNNYDYKLPDLKYMGTAKASPACKTGPCSTGMKIGKEYDIIFGKQMTYVLIRAKGTARVYALSGGKGAFVGRTTLPAPSDHDPSNYFVDHLGRLRVSLGGKTPRIRTVVDPLLAKSKGAATARK